ncbi:MAG TPA: M48 family metalloprotease, partial [Gemmataceae bacterium]|nr:M48 family metalloprotease [Gemmataceae bacterium]
FGLLLAAAGCLTDDKKLATVSPNSVGKPGRVQAASFKQAPPTTQEVALRVDRVGKQIAAANPRINQKVVFLTLGVSHEEVFHQTQKDVSTVFITEGLVKQCKTDGELAAVLSEEIGKMVTEQMVQAQPARRPLSASLLLNPAVGGDVGGTFGSADRTNDMIAARYEKEWEQSRQTLPSPPPPPDSLARIYLSSAGFDPKTLDTVKPLLRKAEKQSSVEQSMTGKQSG